MWSFSYTQTQGAESMSVETEAGRPVIFREAVNWTITTGAAGISLPNKERTLTAEQLIDAITQEQATR